MQQSVGIPMRIDPGPLAANLLPSLNEEEYVSSLISSNKVKAWHSHSTKCFIAHFCSIKDGGKIFLEIYPTKLWAQAWASRQSC